MTDTPPEFDAARLIADVRRGTPEAVAEAYKMTFGHPFGRFVLAHFAAACGVGGKLGVGDLKYHAGRHDAAVELINLAGFDQISAVVAVMTDNLEGSDDEPAYSHAEELDEFDHS